MPAFDIAKTAPRQTAPRLPPSNDGFRSWRFFGWFLFLSGAMSALEYAVVEQQKHEQRRWWQCEDR